MNTLLGFLTTVLIALIVYYYVLIVAQLLGIITVVDSENKLNWKHFIPFYQFFKVFKNEN